jgi:hypothetical protein
MVAARISGEKVLTIYVSEAEPTVLALLQDLPYFASNEQLNNFSCCQSILDAFNLF